MPENLSSVSSSELIQVAKRIDKDETPTTFHRVVVELGRRGTTIDFEALGRGAAENEENDNVFFQHLGTLRTLIRLFLVELLILAALLTALYVVVF